MPSAESIIDALNRYIDGKDNNHPDVLETLYAQDAQLSFSLDDQSMNFPSLVAGSPDIARVLSGDFNKRYQHVKTWYLTRPATAQREVTQHPWLVMMQERESGDVRIGCGYYDWHFNDTDQTTQVGRHHIHIHTMLSFPSSREEWLLTLQQNLSYPWSSIDHMRALLSPYQELEPVIHYLYQLGTDKKED